MDAVRGMTDVGEAPAADVQRIHDETVADLQKALAAVDVIGQAKGRVAAPSSAAQVWQDQ